MYPEEIRKLISRAKDPTGMSLTDFYAENDKLLTKAKELVKDRIKGERKGLPGELNYTHSFRVNEIVSKLHHWDDPDVEMFLAALLHDIIEDGDTALQELVDMGFTRKTIELIYLCSHDKQIENKTERWTMMLSKLIEARNEEAWCIKLIDLSDNLTQCKGLTEENRKFMIEVKAPLMLRLTEWLDGGYSTPYRYYLQKTLEDLNVRPSVFYQAYKLKSWLRCCISGVILLANGRANTKRRKIF